MRWRDASVRVHESDALTPGAGGADTAGDPCPTILRCWRPTCRRAPGATPRPMANAGDRAHPISTVRRGRGVAAGKQLEDLAFEASDQWHPEIKAQRDADKRPCLTIQRISGAVKQIANSERRNPVAVQVNPVDADADPDTAEVLQGSSGTSNPAATPTSAMRRPARVRRASDRGSPGSGVSTSTIRPSTRRSGSSGC